MYKKDSLGVTVGNLNIVDVCAMSLKKSVQFFEKLKLSPEQCMNTSRLMLKGDNVDILPNLIFGNYIGDTKKLIRTADVIRGFPFIKLREFSKFKRELGRQKDLNDIKLINNYLRRKVSGH
jgi:hypothetical protein